MLSTDSGAKEMSHHNDDDDDSSASSESGDHLSNDALLEIPTALIHAVVTGDQLPGFDSELKGRPGTATPAEQVPERPPMAARAYQLEMFEESLKRNIIVAMDTGSGKTQVAVLRIQHEIERSEKMVWFLAPTVALASQQHGVLQTQIPTASFRYICGADDVEAWSTQAVWDAVLDNQRVVVSTYQILFDAVAHSFVRLRSLSLIVIDEAHNCVKKDPVARLMTEFYKRDKDAGLDVPRILGLTASPLMRTDLDDLEVLEATLDSVCKTPNKHRDELMAQVKRPAMKTVPYEDTSVLAAPIGSTQTMSNLNKVYRELDITKDPYVVSLRAEVTRRSQAKLRRVIERHDTESRRQIRSFCNGAKTMYINIGPWAADYYVCKVISGFLSGSAAFDDGLEDLSDEVRRYLADIFRQVDTVTPPTEPTSLSAKTQALVEILDSHKEPSMGIVFVKERATVAVLSHLLSVHPLTKGRYRVGAMVGTSTKPGRARDFLDLSQKEDQFSLPRFRLGQTNLLVATSVLEEGIDVPKCNLVICFDEPKSLKSFIQRRGRARAADSYLYLMVSDAPTKSAEDWLDFERQMKMRYEDEMRETKLLADLEKNDQASDYPVLEAKYSRARLTIHDAKAHLQHFCATLSSRKFVDSSPFYVIRTRDGTPVDPLSPTPISATVHLPGSISPELRTHQSLQSWISEEMACKDAAFQAYRSLYEAGLVNENLLPMRAADIIPDVEPVRGVVEVREQLNPWLNVAQNWRKDDADLFRRRLTISNQENSMQVEVDLILPVLIPSMQPLTLHWDIHSTWTVTMQPDKPTGRQYDWGDDTCALLSMAFGHRNGWTSAEKQFPVRVVNPGRHISIDDIAAQEFSRDLFSTKGHGHLIRDSLDNNHPYFYQDWLPRKPSAETVGLLRCRGVDSQGFNYASAPADVPYVVGRNWPKNVGFFLPIDGALQSAKGGDRSYPRILPADQVKVDSVPAVFAHVGMLIPAITHMLEAHLVASDLLDNFLEKTGIRDLSLIVKALTATSARAPSDYERLEFLGDSILKYCATASICSQYPASPEGILSQLKDTIVANARLFRAAVDFELDKYIIAKQFVLQKPVYVDDLLQISTLEQEAKRRHLSSKMLADVVEAIIGASFVSGGLPKALASISLFLPKVKVKWQNLEIGRKALFDLADCDRALPVTMHPLEGLIGYTFRKKSLLIESMTHATCRNTGGSACYDRLELLGDAILDYIIVTAVFDDETLQNTDMHLLKTALVNADILSFMVMEWGVDQRRFEVVPERQSSGSDDEIGVVGQNNNRTVRVESSTVKQPLWRFMRHSSYDMGVCQHAAEKRYLAMRNDIHKALFEGTEYPWALLLRLQAQKFFSDVFESVLGAVWVDSGSMDECVKMVERSGILPLMRRLMKDGVHVKHPKEELCGLRGGGTTVEYIVSERAVGEEGDDKEYDCVVTVEGEEIAHAGGGLTKEEARVLAAAEACRVLKTR